MFDVQDMVSFYCSNVLIFIKQARLISHFIERRGGGGTTCIDSSRCQAYPRCFGDALLVVVVADDDDDDVNVAVDIS
jgi:hypothetical protein